MKKEIADKWVEALRSGDYQQGQESLAKNGKYCCLGVLCDLASKLNICQATYYDRGSARFDEMGGTKDEYLPKSVIEWAEMKTNDGSYGNYSLSEHNDNGKTFDEIAAIIEENYEEL